MRGFRGRIDKLPDAARSLLQAAIGDDIEQIVFIRNQDVAEKALLALTDEEVLEENSALFQREHISLKEGENYGENELYSTLQLVSASMLSDNPFNFVSRRDCEALRGNRLRQSIYSEMYVIAGDFISKREELIRQAFADLERAVENGDVEAVIKSFTQGAELNSGNEILLKKSIMAGHEVISILLIEQGASLDWCAEEPSSDIEVGDSLLHLAAKLGQAQLVELLIESGIEKNAVDSNGNTALHLAAMRGKDDVVAALLQAGCDTNLKNHESLSAIEIALLQCHDEMAITLASQGSDLTMAGKDGEPIASKYWGMMLHRAVLNKDIEAAEQAVNSGAQLDYCAQVIDPDYRVYKASSPRQRRKIIKAEDVPLIPPLNRKNSSRCITSLHLAAERNDVRMLEFLLDSGIKVDVIADNATALYVASRNGHLDAARLLLERGADVNGNLAEIRSQNESGILPSSGWSPLLDASICNHKEIVKLLLSYKADVKVGYEYSDDNSKIRAKFSAYKVSAIHYLSHYGNIDLIELLVRDKADINVQTEEGDTALTIAIEQGQLEIVKKLLQFGADVTLVKHESASRKTMLDLLDSQLKSRAIRLPLGSRAVGSRKGGYKISVVAESVAYLLLLRGCSYNNSDKCEQIKQQIALDQLLLKNISRGDIDQVRAQMAAGAKANAMNRDFDTALHLAIESRNVAIVKLLLENDADVYATNMDFKSPAMMHRDGYDIIRDILNELFIAAAKKGDLEEMQKLLKKGANVNIADKNGNTAFHHIAFNGYVGAVQILVEHLADSDLVNKSGLKAKDLDIEIAKKIVELQENYQQDLALLKAIRGDDPKWQEIAEQHGNFDLRDYRGANILHIAVEARAWEVVGQIVMKYPQMVASKDLAGRHVYQYTNHATLRDLYEILLSKHREYESSIEAGESSPSKLDEVGAAIKFVANANRFWTDITSAYYTRAGGRRRVGGSRKGYKISDEEPRRRVNNSGSVVEGPATQENEAYVKKEDEKKNSEPRGQGESGEGPYVSSLSPHLSRRRIRRSRHVVEDQQKEDSDSFVKQEEGRGVLGPVDRNF